MRLDLELVGTRASSIAIPGMIAGSVNRRVRHFAGHQLGFIPYDLTPANFWERLDTHLSRLPMDLVAQDKLGEYVKGGWAGSLDWAGQGTWDAEALASLMVEYADDPTVCKVYASWKAAGGTEAAFWLAQSEWKRRTLDRIASLAPNVSWRLYAEPLLPSSSTVGAGGALFDQRRARLRQLLGRELAGLATGPATPAFYWYPKAEMGPWVTRTIDALSWPMPRRTVHPFFTFGHGGVPMPAADVQAMLAAFRARGVESASLWGYVDATNQVSVQNWVTGTLAPAMVASMKGAA